MKKLILSATLLLAPTAALRAYGPRRDREPVCRPARIRCPASTT